MSHSIKAALLSALVFPGSGHLFLKQKARGYAILLTTFFCLWVIISDAYNQALKVVQKMQAQGMVVDMDRVSELSEMAAQNNDDMTSSLAIFLLLVCWLISIIDSYRLGKIMDQTADK